MNRKIVAMLAAMAMVMMAGVVVVSDFGESDASGSIGNVNIYYTTDLQTYTLETACGFNLSDALNSETTLLSTLKSTVDNAYSKQYTNDYGSYTSINDEWGNIIRNSSDAVEGSVWNVFVYTFDDEDELGQWKIADMTLGFYKPFSDYDVSYATANIALYYGPEQSDAPANLPTTGLQSLTEVTETSTFEFTFDLYYTNSTGSAHSNLTGYGSDAALALIDAVGSTNVNIDLTPGLSYGYMVSLYNLSTVDNGDGTWSWWNMYNNTLGSTTMTFSDYYLGFYIPLPGFALSCDTIELRYI